MKIRKKICSGLVAAAMMLTALPVNASAEMIEYSGNLPYSAKSAPFGKQGSERLTGAAKSYFDQTLQVCKDISEGKRTGTEFELTLTKKVSTSQLSEYWQEAVNALLYEYPEYSFWLLESEISAGYYSESRVVNASINLIPSGDYKGSKANTVDSAKIKAGAASIAKADKIAAKYEGKSDYEKIKGYCDEISALTDYNHEAIASMEGGNPWQMPWVFDGDPKTNVVCEGYAKAFYYLCKKGGVECFIVTGNMSGGGHMWNIAIVDGKSYLVDITNTDGFDENFEIEMDMPYMFLLKGGADSNEYGCTVTTPEKKVSWKEGSRSYTYTVSSSNVNYKYDENTRALYSKSLLTVSKSDYTVHTHKGEGEYKVNGSYHWKNCKTCGGVASFASHKFDGKGVCEKCGAKKK
ncbi:MAG: hypothetical protein K2N72_04660 [Oscillospiraceae bacterium]|nr:hypothetical protein [Oscillospiraceae bacterium]